MRRSIIDRLADMPLLAFRSKRAWDLAQQLVREHRAHAGEHVTLAEVEAAVLAPLPTPANPVRVKKVGTLGAKPGRALAVLKPMAKGV